jgi:hypothetical protein
VNITKELRWHHAGRDAQDAFERSKIHLAKLFRFPPQGKRKFFSARRRLIA